MDKVECYIDKKGEYRWRVRHQNGNIRSVSSEGYKGEGDCLKSLLATHEAIHNLLGANLDGALPTQDPLPILKGCGLFKCEE